MPKKEAAQWLAAELKRSGVKQPNERAIGAREIIRWHAELGGKSMKWTDKFFFEWVHDFERRGFLKAQDRKEAQVFARKLISHLRILGF